MKHCIDCGGAISKDAERCLGCAGVARRRSPLERFKEKVQVDSSGCWLWLAGHHQAYGYARFCLSDQTINAHRAAFELFIGPIPEDYTVDHLCGNRGCVNPEHLEAVTSSENSRREMEARPRLERCRRGHSRENAYIRPSDGRWVCRECLRMTNARLRATKRHVEVQVV